MPDDTLLPFDVPAVERTKLTIDFEGQPVLRWRAAAPAKVTLDIDDLVDEVHGPAAVKRGKQPLQSIHQLTRHAPRQAAITNPNASHRRFKSTGPLHRPPPACDSSQA